MNARVCLAAALAASLGVACSKAPTSDKPEDAPSGGATLRKLGQWQLTMTPIPGTGRFEAVIEFIPDAKDGNPTTNPPGTVQVLGVVEGIIAAGGTATGGAANPCGAEAVYADVAITNFAVDPLGSTYARLITQPPTGHEVCNKAPVPTDGVGATLIPPPGNTYGLWGYGAIAGSTVNDGSLPGGVGHVTTGGGGWWFKYGTGSTPFQIRFDIWADPGRPVPVSSPYIGAGMSLSWSSPGVAETQLEFCLVDNCTTPTVVGPIAETTPGSGLFTWAFGAPLSAGRTYFWRARNVYGLVPGNFPSTYDPVAAVNPPTKVAPPDLAVFDGAAPAIDLAWTAASAVTHTWLELCSTADCVGSVLFQGAVPATALGSGGFAFDALAVVPTDPASFGTYLQAGTYSWRVYLSDGVNGPAVPYSAAARSFTITPVVLTPAITLGAAASTPFTDQTGPVDLAWSTDPVIPATRLFVCGDVTCTTTFLNLNGQPPGTESSGLLLAPAVIGATADYAFDVWADLPFDVNTGLLLPATYFWRVYPADVLAANAGDLATTPFAAGTITVTP